MPMYGCQLWNIAYCYNYDRLRVAFNDAFRLLLLLSASLLIHCMTIRNSSNSLLLAYMESDLYYRSKVLHKWRRLLYTCMV